MSDASHVIWRSLTRGLRRKCPHCGQGQLLDGWLTVRRACPICGLVYERSPGDTWALWIVGDRIPIGVGIAAIYFGLRPHTWVQAALFLLALGVPLIGTIPHRLGLVIALDYLSRRYWPDPADFLPPLPNTPSAKGDAR